MRGKVSLESANADFADGRGPIDRSEEQEKVKQGDRRTCHIAHVELFDVVALLKEEQINCIKQLKVRDVVAKQLYFGIAGAEVDGDDAQSVAGYFSEVFVGLFGERCAAQQGET
ncbi:hypothetical protein PC128_g23141 [Phytophthora cactorum]|nr:hypothetical protein PC120_g17078 [Phytophthora cactorum]KAG3051575.1 hypothetical protein PC121_g17791 [Phytophthora cactorum]KAG3150675.1 hypothetical protein PC128_g23141 [Phytophthora cactorum]KAG4042046.1 hypothetical protein PC123_g22461 [Phytophthora cactorum]